MSIQSIHQIRTPSINIDQLHRPYRDGIIAGLFVPAEGASGPAPLIVMVNGLDSTKEMIYRVGLPRALSRRGVAPLVIDQPGTGEALRLHGLQAVHDSES